MAKIKFTDSQKAAIVTKAPEILISAAAGSGKSTVLTERIIHSITSDKIKYDISKILAVTFTKASAEDLRAKISKAVNNAVLADPKNIRLKNQLTKLASAKISTIHGYCYSLIKGHFQMLGLSASTRVLDDVEAAAMRSEVLSDLLEGAYAGYFAPIRDFSAFAERFVNEEDKELESMFMQVYTSIKNIPNGFEEWEKKIGSIPTDGNLQGNAFGNLMLFHLSLFADYSIKLYQHVTSLLSADDVYSEKYLPAFMDDLSFIKKLKDAAGNGDFEQTSALVNTFKATALGQARGYSTEEGEYAKESRKFFKDKLDDFKMKYFSLSTDKLKEIGEATVSTSKAVIDFLKEFDKRFSEEKRKRSVLDFNDLEHYALALLYNPDGSYSDVAKSVSESLDEIYVDEYQDVNPLQNKIFEALSCECPIFTVGDIKQSIYRFRGAQPQIFSELRRSFNEYTEGVEIYPDNVQILLSENFRSASTVTDFVNAVTEPLFITEGKENYYSYRIPYTAKDRLDCRAEIKDAPDVSILICDKKKPAPVKEEDNSNGNEAAVTDKKETNPESKDEELDALRLEAEMVANKIASILSDKKNKTDPEEIAVLLRNTKTDGAVFEAALKRRNIPISTEKGACLFDAPEIQLSLCLLNCIDNPYRDIFLAGALRSPVFGFTLNDLIEIKALNPNAASLFDSLREYVRLKKHNGECFEKGEIFLKFLEKLRAFSSQNTVDRTLWQIYTETHFFSLIYDGGAALGSLPTARRANLLKLHGIAKSFAETGKGDLFSFIEHLRNMAGSTKPPSAAVQSGGVKIMTIHHSKGLEFEHCFLSRTASLFSTKSHNNSVALDNDYGIAMRINDALGLTAANTPLREAIIFQGDLLSAEEEMRLLYVALSRAKKALYVSGAVGIGRAKGFSNLEAQCLNSSKTPHPYMFLTQRSYLKWILTALKCKTDIAPRYSCTVYSADEILNEAKTAVLTEDILISTVKEEDVKDAKEILKARFDYVYPFKTASLIPSKLSVSTLTPKILDSIGSSDVSAESDAIPPSYDLESELSHSDGDTQSVSSEEKSDNAPKMNTPAFLLDDPVVTAAEKGTATHVFMQFCDFSLVQKNGVDAEIQRLLDKRFILPSHAEMIDRIAVKRFFSSELYQNMKNAASLTREYRFNIKLPASEFTEKQSLKELLHDEFIFVQGVIDCYFRDNEGRIYLLDYKTDRIPKDRRGDTDAENTYFTNEYSRQLKYYEKALEKLTGKRVFKKLIYSFALGRTVEIK